MTISLSKIDRLDSGEDNPRRRSIVDLLAGTKKQIRNEWVKELIQELEAMREDEIMFLNRTKYSHGQLCYAVTHYTRDMRADKVAFTIKTVKGGWKIWRWK